MTKTLITISLLFVAGFAAAQQPYTLSVPIPGAPAQVTDPAQYIRIIYQFGLGIAGLVAMARIIYAAIVIMTAAGNTSKISDAKDMITQAIFGLVLLFGATLILYTIDPKLIRLQLPQLEPVSVQKTETQSESAAFNQAFDTLQQTTSELQRARLSGDELDIARAEVRNLEAEVLATEAQLAGAYADMAAALRLVDEETRERIGQRSTSYYGGSYIDVAKEREASPYWPGYQTAVERRLALLAQSQAEKEELENARRILTELESRQQNAPL